MGQQIFTSPLRYPGGKGQLANFMKLVLLLNELSDGEYAELYAGGAGIACSLLLEEYVSQVHINDLDPSIHSFWYSVLHSTEDLCKLIADTPVTMDEWHKQRAIHLAEKDDKLAMGFSAFFLNRTNRSGIINGGVIGGKDQAGKWKLDVRFNKPDLISRIKRIARYEGRIKLYNLDASQLIQSVLPKLPKRTLVYCDPPYFAKGKDLYENHYTAEDHQHVAGLITGKIKQPWIVSYDMVPQIEEIYAGQLFRRYKVTYTAQWKYAGAEILYYSKGLQLPVGVDPASISRKELINRSRAQMLLSV